MSTETVRQYLPLQVKILDPRIGDVVPLPKYGTPDAAGLDLYAAIEEALVIEPGQSVLVPTGLSIFIDNPNYAAMLLPRSGLGHKQGLVLGNLVGLIDSDYQGPLMVSLWNRSNEPRCIQVFDRIAQMVVVPVIQVGFEVVTEFKPTDRGDGGFGSTGVSVNVVPHVSARGCATSIIMVDDSPFNAPGEAVKTWAVWTEGYQVSGNSSLAILRGHFLGKTFEDACKAWIESLPPESRHFYNEKDNSFWGCRLFDNEADARKAFG